MAALPFVVVMIGLAIALTKDLSQDPVVVRRAYAFAAVEQAVVAGVTEHGDDFQLTVEQTPPGEGVGELVPTQSVEPTADPSDPAPRPDAPGWKGADRDAARRSAEAALEPAAEEHHPSGR